MKDWTRRFQDRERAQGELGDEIRAKAHPLVRQIGSMVVGGDTYTFRLNGVRLRAIVEVEVHEDELWAHLSVSAQSPPRIPSWVELRWAKEHFLGDRRAVQILPPRAEYVNMHPHVLNLFAPLERNPLPDFRVFEPTTGMLAI